jgi:16S rRNA (cytidine1402-2'-O)-methyltransferase
VLYVVATPIGNLADISPRALEILAAVDLIAAEDTRHSRRLLDHYGIRTPATPLHEHNERQAAERLLARVAGGESLALVSDAGTPLVSDPGFRLVRGARARGLAVVPVPGACAAIAALSVAGLPSDRFVFEGFLPARQAARRTRLAELAAESRTLIFYESGRRLADALRDIAGAFGGQRRLVLARELTKLHETVLDGTADALLQRVDDDPDQCRGELVLLAEGCTAETPAAEAERLLAALLDEGLSVSRAASVAARLTGRPRRELYRTAQQRHDAAPRE